MLTFFHCPHTRSSSIHYLLEELGVPYESEIIDIRAEGGAPESYRAIQPHKKVPAIRHNDVVVTERAAITLYLADAFPEAGLAPALDDPRRGPYLTSVIYIDSVVDPCLVAHMNQWPYDGKGAAYGKFEDMVANLERTLSSQDYAVGDRFTAADTQWGVMMYWALDVMGLFKDKPVFRAYLNRLADRPAFQRFAKVMAVAV
ncbi:glutathione S-transferase family protein [Nitrospirillum viridazoti]|uniref:Glutathione S-transferase n=1 Tax=Nitrospirillum amazonense TaxID=28077 RepID=A0A560IGX6_9PROT|nr:glutathione S-transferase family protein [Nitrospirillum amazonense]TWB56060.1 glutathione S-transferase [Nitrospirillum amazonense]